MKSQTASMSSPLSSTDRAYVGRELGKAQAAIERVRKMASVQGDHRLAKGLGDQVKALGEQIVYVHDTPKIAIGDLLNG